MAYEEHKYDIICTETGRLDSAATSLIGKANMNCNPDIAEDAYFGSIQIVCDTDKLGVNFFETDSLIERDAHKSKEKYLGEIVEMLLDLQTGKVGYVKLSFNGNCVDPGRIFAVPRDTPASDVDKIRTFLSIEKNGPEDTTGIHWDSWPNMADHSWMDDIRNYCGV